MRCEDCGRDLPEGAAFCPECGGRTPTRSAAELVDIAHTSGLVRGRAAGEVPDAPDLPEIPDSVPEIPDSAPLPEAASGGGGVSVTGEATLEATLTSSVDKARIREEARQAAQALVESAQVELEQELEEGVDGTSIIADRGYELERVYPSDEPPPPPPPSSAEERMWGDTIERAKLHGTEMPWGEEEDTTPEWQKEEQAPGEKLVEIVEKGDKNCCAYGCVALFVILFLFFLVGFIMNFVQ